ncbi:MAG: hypothetical protein ACRDUX_01380 [Mycobacterium sp.]
MDRPYATYSPTSGTATRGARTDERDAGGYGSYDSYEDYDDGYEDGYDEIYEYEDPIDRRWIWVAGVAGAILLIAVICTVVILGGGDSGSVSKTIIATTPTTAPVATSTAPPVRTSAAPPPVAVAPLSPETVTTVAPSPSPTASADPAPAGAAASPNAITYLVTGTRPLLDLVTVVYTDAQGALQTEFNVALPWSRTVTLDPGVALKSVTATSLTGQLNCSITDASGAAIVTQATNSMITTCTK